MCGILGYIKLQNGRFDEEFKTDIASLFVFSQARGKHATGFAMLNPPQTEGSPEDFHPVFVDKAPVQADEFILRDAWNDLELPNVLIGHTRWKTKGDQANNDNNHPIMGGFSAVVHNGSIQNDDALFKEYSFERRGQVDSEIIIQLLEHYAAEMPIEDAIRAASSKMRGKFACAYISPTRPDTLFLFRHDNPLVLGYIKELGIIVFASEKKFIENAFTALRVDEDFNYFEKMVPRFDIWYREIDDDSAMVITPEGIASTFKIEAPKTYTQVTHYGGNYGGNYGSRNYGDSTGGSKDKAGFQSQQTQQGCGGSNQGNAAGASGGKVEGNTSCSGGSEDEIDKRAKDAEAWWANQYVKLYTCPSCKTIDEVQSLVDNKHYCTNKSCNKSLMNHMLHELDVETISRRDWEDLKSVAGPDGLQKVI